MAVDRVYDVVKVGLEQHIEILLDVFGFGPEGRLFFGRGLLGRGFGELLRWEAVHFAEYFI